MLVYLLTMTKLSNRQYARRRSDDEIIDMEYIRRNRRQSRLAIPLDATEMKELELYLRNKTLIEIESDQTREEK